jgi:RNA polymerase sigma factor (TIGR02999 family)
MAGKEASEPAPTMESSSRARGDRLFAALYDDLRRVAEREVRRNSNVTLSPTTLLHETFLNGAVRDFAELADRGRFMVYASRAMRGLIIDYLRHRRAQKRGGEIDFIQIDEEVHDVAVEADGLRYMEEALQELEKIDPRLVQCIDLKFFCGFSFAEIARFLDISERTVQRDWEKARVLLSDLIIKVRQRR